MRVVFAGTPYFAVSALEALIDAPGIEVVGVVSQPDRPAGRGMRLTPSPVKQAALEAHIDVITPEKLRGDDEALAWLQGKQADVLVVVAFGMLLPKSWLTAPKVAPVNVHASLLPRWRGAAPIERAMLAGDAETGVCIMHMEEGLDTGDVYACRMLEISPLTSGTQLAGQLSAIGAELLVETLPSIVDGTCERLTQHEADATYAAKLSGEDRLIDWSRPATIVDRQVRCFAPKPGARTRVKGKWLKVIAGEVLEHTTLSPAGSWIGKEHFDIACGDGTAYRLLEVQPEGKKAMEAEAFLRGSQLTPGEILA
jgi:methionyl-tRNA formyltransferase